MNASLLNALPLLARSSWAPLSLSPGVTAYRLRLPPDFPGLQLIRMAKELAAARRLEPPIPRARPRLRLVHSAPPNNPPTNSKGNVS